MSFYEGRFYGTLMARLQAGLNAFICNQVEAGLRVLEAGCGAGNLTLLLSRTASSVVAVDSSSEMLAYARKRARAVKRNEWR